MSTGRCFVAAADAPGKAVDVNAPGKAVDVNPPRVAVILAAGRGERLRGYDARPKPLIRLLGVSLAERVVRSLLAAAPIERIVVSLGYEADRVRAHFESIGSRCGAPMEFVSGANWRLGNGASALASECATGTEPFLLTMSDHVFTPDLIVDLLAAPPRPGGIAVAVDGNRSAIFDPDDVTRVRLSGAFITAIGKGLASWDAADTGLLYCSAGLYEGLRQAAAGNEHGLSSGVATLAASGLASGVDVTGHWWKDVDSPAALRDAEEHLVRVAGGKQNDGPVARYLNRPVSRRLTRWLVRTPVSPNQLSLIVFGIACIAAAGMAAGPYWALVAGGLLAQFCSIVDGSDGEVARLRFEQSAFGGWFDAVLDRYADAILLFGLAWRAMYTHAAGLCVAAGFAAVIGTFLNSYTADKYDGLMRERTEARIRLGRDVRMLLVAVGAVLDQTLVTLWFIALLMNGEVVRRIVVCWRDSLAARALQGNVAKGRTNEQPTTAAGRVR